MRNDASSPRENSAGDSNAASDESIRPEPAALANMDGSCHQLAMHAVSIEYVVMVENADVGTDHRVSAYLDTLGSHGTDVRVHVDVVPNAHRCTRAHLQPRPVIDISTGPQLHTAARLDHEANASSEIDRLPTMVQPQPRAKPQLGHRNPDGTRTPFDQLP